jgi:hypothetical protein
MKDFEQIARKMLTPVAQKYGLKFAALDGDEFFLIGQGFAFWVFADPRDGADVWYVTIDNSGNVLTYTLMYLMEERFTSEDSANYGDPNSLDERVSADLRTAAAWLMNKCQDVLTGDKSWLQGYPDDGDYSRHVTKFLAPYFIAQGYPVIVREDR